MVNIEIRNKSGKIVGYANLEEKFYSKIVDYSLGQMFYAPKYRGSIGISIDIINKLLRLGITTLKFYVRNFDKQDFLAVMPLKEFIEKGNEVFFSGKQNSDRQIICPIHNFIRIYGRQMLLK